MNIKPYTLKPSYKLTITIRNSDDDVAENACIDDIAVLEDGTVICNNCKIHVPERTITMHEAFCFRNNTYCPKCNRVYKKADYESHWHCDSCSTVNL